MKALLFSGGMDSTALAYRHRPDLCVTIDYGQRPAKGEMAAASSICAELKIAHEVVTVDLRHLGSGSLAGTEPSEIGNAAEWWPYRNQMLVTVAAMALLPKGLNELSIGAVSTDVHADGKAPFLRALDTTMRHQEGAVRLSAPALRLSPWRLILESRVPRSLLGATFSCHTMEYACGQCRGCEKHRDTLARIDHLAERLNSAKPKRSIRKP